jgi:hypothetical protein
MWSVNEGQLVDCGLESVPSNSIGARRSEDTSVSPCHHRSTRRSSPRWDPRRRPTRSAYVLDRRVWSRLDGTQQASSQSPSGYRSRYRSRYRSQWDLRQSCPHLTGLCHWSRLSLLPAAKAPAELRRRPARPPPQAPWPTPHAASQHQTSVSRASGAPPERRRGWWRARSGQSCRSPSRARRSEQRVRQARRPAGERA